MESQHIFPVSSFKANFLCFCACGRLMSWSGGHKKQLKLLHDPRRRRCEHEALAVKFKFAANCFRQILIGPPLERKTSTRMCSLASSMWLWFFNCVCFVPTSRHATLTALLNNRFRRRLSDFYQLTGGTMSSTCTQLRQHQQLRRCNN